MAFDMELVFQAYRHSMQWPEEAASPGIKAIQLGCLLGSLIEEDLCKAEGSCQLAVYVSIGLSVSVDGAVEGEVRRV